MCNLKINEHWPREHARASDCHLTAVTIQIESID